MIVFLDACALIYLMEGTAPLHAKAHEQLMAATQAHPDARTALSRLTWLECRVGPMKNNNIALLEHYDAFFAQPDLVWVELDRHVIELAAAIRARHGLRTPDALQAASCLQLGPEHRLLTGDADFRHVPGLNVLFVH